jgi:hypothetical protein
MFNLNTTGFSAKVLNRMFRQVDGLKWDLQTGSLGVVGKDGSIATLIKTEVPAVAAVEATAVTPAVAAQPASVEYNISVNPFDMFSVAIPAFATQTRLENVKEGDLVVGAEKILGFVIGKTAASLKLRDFDGFTKNYTPPKVQILGNDGVLVVQSLGSLFGGQTGVGGFQSLLMPLLLANGNSTEGLDSILPLILFSQLQTANPAVAADAATAAGNPALAASPIASMLPFLLLKGAGKKGSTGGSKGGAFGDIDPMMLMMMSGGFGGGAQAGGMNPMMLLALAKGGFGGDDEPEAPALVSVPRTSAASGNFAPALTRTR